MPLEIEIKIKIPDHDPIRRLLRRHSAKPIEYVRETNIFFDRPDHSLRKANTGLRVRLSIPIKSKIRNQKSKMTALLTFKGPPAKKGLRSREAFDLHITPYEQLIPLLTALGFQQLFLFEKIRESWLLAKCRVELDTLPYFGTFLEIEGPSEKAVHRVQKMLGLQSLPQEKTSYAAMTGNYLANTHRKALRFKSRKR
jgi:adenylate cyclase class 2